MSLSDYVGPASVAMNSRPLIEIVTIRVRRMSNAKPVKTLPKGLAGRTKGAPEVTIDMSNAIPAAGYETNMRDLVITQDLVTIDVRAAGTQDTYIGWFDSGEQNSEVDTVSLEQFQFHGKLLTSHPATSG